MFAKVATRDNLSRQKAPYCSNPYWRWGIFTQNEIQTTNQTSSADCRTIAAIAPITSLKIDRIEEMEKLIGVQERFQSANCFDFITLFGIVLLLVEKIKELVSKPKGIREGKSDS